MDSRSPDRRCFKCTYLRDTVVAVQKQLKFPASLTEEQKLSLMDYFSTLTPKGYETEFELTSPDIGYSYSETKKSYITQRDPAGNYKSYVALGENPTLGYNFVVEETKYTEIPGLELSTVTFQVQLYSGGAKYGDIQPSEYIETQIKAGNDLLSLPFRLEGSVKIADVTVINEYKEKQITR